LAINIAPDIDIKELKAVVSSKIGLDPDSFDLYWTGKRLLAGTSCGTYGLRSWSTVQLVRRLTGG
jgi:hypothetical protein